MAFQDLTLDNLKQTQDVAWKNRSRKRDWVNDRFEQVKQLQSIHGPRIDWLTSEHDNMYRQMVDAYERSKACFGTGDHGGASSWSAQGREFKARMQAASSERRQLVDTMKGAQAEFAAARAEFQKAKLEHERAQAAFKERLEYLKQRFAKDREQRQRERERRDKERAEMRLQKERDRQARRTENDRRREAVRQRREEFVDVARRRARALTTVGPRDSEHHRDFVVKTKIGYSRKHDMFTTDVLIFYKDPSIDYHFHIVFAEDGTELINDPKRPNKQA